MRGSATRPLRVMLIPADGGTEEGTRADFEPVFNAITRMAHLYFEIRVGQSYNAVVQGMMNEQVDVAFLGRSRTTKLSRPALPSCSLWLRSRVRVSITRGFSCEKIPASITWRTCVIRVWPLETLTRRPALTFRWPC